MSKKTVILIFVLVASVALWVSGTSAQWRDHGMGQGSRWSGGMCRMMDVTVEPVDPASLPEPSSHGAKILQGKCTQCHGLVSPKRHGKEDWRHIVDRMDRRMRMMGRHGMGMRGAAIKSLDLEEKSILLAYLQKYALKALRGPDVPLAESPGAKKFSSVCSQCHVLPDPASHLTEEWPAVVERMAQYMFNMGFGELNATDKESIVSYLQSQTSN